MIDTEKLHTIFSTITSANKAHYADVFAAGCYLHSQGKKAAGMKMIRDCLARVNRMTNEDHSEFFEEVISQVPGNERLLAMATPLHVEFRALFNR